jgi:ferrochelatase
VRRYLAEFLADPRVVELPRWLWLPLLHAVVLRTRPRRSAQKYAKIWTAEGSPLAVHTRRQAERLAARLAGVRVAWAMRYGEPSLAAGLAELAGCDAIRVLPLYPQYSRSTTESVRDRLPPGTPMVEHFHDHPGYIGALAAALRRHWAHRGRAERLVLSFHGLPARAVARGDPYRQQCEETARRLCAALGLSEGEALVTFQSRFGPGRWLEPYTVQTLVALARSGVRTVDVACPGFVSDCLETLEEIGIGAREAFEAAGGSELRLVPCLNENPEWIEALAAIALDSRPAGPK